MEASIAETWRSNESRAATALSVFSSLRCRASRRALACSDSASIRLCNSDPDWSIAPSPSLSPAARRVGGAGALVLLERRFCEEAAVVEALV
jgi:hypothetical protein